MNNKIKVFGILLLAGFSFFYTNKVTEIIRNNDPIMIKINDIKDDMYVSKIDRVTMNDEYITGINGCIVDEKESYNKMKNVGKFDEDMIVMKEDTFKNINNSYIVGGNNKNRNVSIILLKTDNNIKKNIKINYFLDGKYISDNIDKLIKISKYSKIYNYGRNNTYIDKYIVYDNLVISSNFNNESIYCLVDKNNKKELNLCSKYGMKTIKSTFINSDILEYVKENITNGKIFVFSNYNYEELKISINYILSKGYNIVYLDELLDEKNECN